MRNSYKIRLIIKKQLFVLYIIAFIAFFSGCKKGDDDPFLSLRTRNNRLAGHWEMVEFVQYYNEGTDQYNNSTYEYSFKDGNVTKTCDGLIVDSYQYNESWEFLKNGTYKIKYFVDGTNILEQGVWTWNENDKNSNYKKKECIYLTQNIINFQDDIDLYEYSGHTLSPSSVVAIKRLSEKTLILETEYYEYIKGTGYKNIVAEYKLKKTK